jgi:N6-L-threonylcarbamoyladenine synthase
MLFLGIESSCDETALALVQDGRRVVASHVASQIKIHERWGGVIPEIAAREHLPALSSMYQKLLKTSEVSPQHIDAIAVTQGPGLIGCLLVGVSFAKGLAQSSSKPLVPVNHVHAHVHGALLGIDAEYGQIFPTLALVVSGGHTNLYYMSSWTDFELLAHTIDDACGESFDKVGKMLGLPYPGGPHVETLAKSGDAKTISLPRMIERKSQMAFSYSGLKTAVARVIKDDKTNASQHADIAAAFQEEALGQIVRKLEIAQAMRPRAQSIIVAGGVAANSRFKTLIKESTNLPVWFPEQRFCSDNGAMIAALGYHMYRQNQNEKNLGWDVFSRYPFEKFQTPDTKSR